MEFVRPTLSADVLRAAAVEEMGEGEKVQVAGWPVARQHPRGQDGTVFVTIEDESGDVQLIPWPKVFAKCRRVLGNQVILVRDKVSRWDGATNVVVSGVERIGATVSMLPPTTDTRQEGNWESAHRGLYVTEMPPKWDNWEEQ